MTEQRDRRSIILERAAELFAEKGVSATTVREIAEAVGMLSGSLYHHFKSKDDMVDAIVMKYLKDITQRYSAVTTAGGDPRTQLAELIRNSLAIIETHPHASEIYQNSGNYLSTLENYGAMRTAADSIQETWLTVLEAGAADGTFRPDMPAKVQYRLMRDALWLSVRWFRPTRQYPMSRFAEDLSSMFLDGLTPRTNPQQPSERRVESPRPDSVRSGPRAPK